MNVDDAGRRAGADLRERFDRAPAPPLAKTGPRRPRSGRTAVLMGVAAVLALVLLVLVATPWSEPTSTGGPGGTWRRVASREAFGGNASPNVIGVWQDRFLALGRQRGRPAVWTSSDGAHWDQLPVEHAPRSFGDFTSVAVRGSVIVATTTDQREGAGFWRSTDGARWREVARAVPTGPTTTYQVSRRPGGFVAVSQSPTGSTIALASRDGRSWSGTASTRDLDYRTGLFPGAPLDRSFITIWGVQPGTDRPLVYRSRDRIRWDRIVDADAPERLALPLAGDRARTVVLGIAYEARGTFGGRLFSTQDGATWTEIPSFHAQMPVANPDHLVQVGRWWVLGGNTGTPDGNRRASMWSTPDLRHWYEMPARLRGPKTDGSAVTVTANGGRVVGYAPRGAGGGPNLWVWTRPD